MPGDPNECREHALRCAELAAGATNPELKAHLLELERIWKGLAAELTLTNALVAALDAKSKTSP